MMARPSHFSMFPLNALTLEGNRFNVFKHV